MVEAFSTYQVCPCFFPSPEDIISQHLLGIFTSMMILCSLRTCYTSCHSLGIVILGSKAPNKDTTCMGIVAVQTHPRPIRDSGYYHSPLTDFDMSFSKATVCGPSGLCIQHLVDAADVLAPTSITTSYFWKSPIMCLEAFSWTALVKDRPDSSPDDQLLL